LGWFRKAFLIVWGGALLVLAGMIVFDWVEESRSRAEGRRQNEETIRQLTLVAQRCIDRFAARDPRADAEADFRRGDATPIGHTNFPHEGEVTTSYPAAVGCEQISIGAFPDFQAGTLAPENGKWLRHSASSFEFISAPNQHVCDNAENHYVHEYNKRMSELAPAAVAGFCRRREEEDNRRSAISPSSPPPPGPGAAGGP
jgi:hypothetical protein